MRQTSNVFLSAIKFLIPFCVFALLTIQSVSAQSTDSTTVSDKEIEAEDQNTALSDEYVDEDFAPGLAIMILFYAVLMMVAVGIGIVLSVLVVVAIFGLVAAGLLSASTLVGLHRKSFEAGFKTFVISVSAIGGLVLCSLVFVVVNAFLHWWSTTIAVFAGAGFGLVAGLLFGVMVSYVLIWLTGLMKDRLKLTKG